MKRKVVKLGPATLVVSLPSKWVRKTGVKAGDEVDVEEEESSLVVSSGKAKGKAETSITIKDITESSIRTLITNTYRMGYDRIRVSFETEAHFKILNNVIQKTLIGFEVLRRDKQSCVIENLTEPSGEQFDALVQKLLYNISDLLELTRKRLKKESIVEDYKEIEEKIQQYDNFCRRVIAKDKTPSKESALLWSFNMLRFLGMLGHGNREIYHLNESLDKNRMVFSKDTLKLMDGCIEIFELIKKGYLGKNIKLVEEAHAKEKKVVYSMGYSTLKKHSKESVAIYHLMAAARQFYLSSSPLGALLL